jgi:hypothetical protein
MGAMLIVILGALIAWANVAAIRSLREHRAGARWWYAAAALWAAGALAGVWGGFFAEYQPSPRLRVYGAPVPVGLAVWEGTPGEERWVGFVSSAPHFFAALNVPLVALLAGSVIGPAYWLARRRMRQSGPAAASRPTGLSAP